MSDRSALFTNEFLPGLLFGLVLTGILLFSAFRPFHNWDLIPYIACALEWEGVEDVHAETYRIIGTELPDPTFSVLTAGEYRERCYRDSAFFVDRLPFYRVKPLYIGMVRLGRMWGLPWTFAVRLPSLIALLAIGLLLWTWFRSFLPPLHRVLVTSLSLAIFPVTELARLSTPDGLAVFFLLLCFYLIERKHRPSPLLFLSLFLAVIARVDYALYVLVILTSLRFLSHSDRRHGSRPEGIFFSSPRSLLSFF